MRIDFSLLCPELTAFAVLAFLLLVEIMRPSLARKWAVPVSMAGALLAFFAVLTRAHVTAATFSGVFILDAFASFFKGFFALTTFVIIRMSVSFFQSNEERLREFLLVVWCTLLGLFFLVSSNDFLMVFLSLEIVTLSFYIMAAYMRRQMISIEAGLKYFILGSLASAFFIYGISLAYVATGSTSLPSVRLAFAADPANRLMILSLLIMISAVGFKIASVPFQLWVADVYQGAPTPVVAFLSVASKAAGFAILLRLLFTVFFAFDSPRVVLFSVLAAMTILYGNLGALVQTNIKRLFGYSSIGHAGYLLIGVAAGGLDGNTAVLFYLLAYGMTNLAAFLVINEVSLRTGDDGITAYRGLARREPVLAAVLFVSLLSLAGIPPLAGFVGKFLILLAAVESGLIWLALLGALTVAVSLYYYLSIVKTMYVDEPASPELLNTGPSFKLLIVSLAALIVITGIWQAPFFNAARVAAVSLF
jgi:NADH-quinone oxidoreductase subunit N